jgi:tetratricopeptide (TPR) repeat protein
LDPEIRNFADNARGAHERGSYEQAAILYRKALTRAKLMGLSGEAGRIAYNLAVCQLALGRPAEAQKLLREARMLLSGRTEGMARMYVAEAEAAHMQGELSNAVILVSAALDCGPKSGDTLQAELLLGEVRMEQGNLPESKTHYRRAIRLVADDTVPMVHARIDRLGALLIQAQVIEGDAAEAWERRAGWLRTAGQYRQMAESLIQAGSMFDRTGRSGQAFECWARAAQSLDSMGEHVLAGEAVQRAVDLSRRIGDPLHVERARILSDSLTP